MISGNYLKTTENSNLIQIEKLTERINDFKKDGLILKNEIVLKDTTIKENEIFYEASKTALEAKLENSNSSIHEINKTLDTFIIENQELKIEVSKTKLSIV